MDNEEPGHAQATPSTHTAHDLSHGVVTKIHPVRETRREKAESGQLQT